MQKYREDRQREWYNEGLEEGLRRGEVVAPVVAPVLAPVPAPSNDIRQEMYLAIMRLYRELRMACPIKYSDGVLTVSAGKAQRSHEFGE